MKSIEDIMIFWESNERIECKNWEDLVQYGMLKLEFKRLVGL